MRTRTAKSGFTLIELMIVVALIALLASIAIPLMVRMKMGANETSAVASMKMIATGQESYRTSAFADADSNGEGDFGSLSQLGNPDGGNLTEPFIDAVLASGIKSGYRFVANATPGGAGTTPRFQAFAVPTSPGASGYKQIFVDETQVIRHTNDGTAVGPTSPALD